MKLKKRLKKEAEKEDGERPHFPDLAVRREETGFTVQFNTGGKDYSLKVLCSLKSTTLQLLSFLLIKKLLFFNLYSLLLLLTRPFTLVVVDQEVPEVAEEGGVTDVDIPVFQIEANYAI